MSVCNYFPVFRRLSRQSLIIIKSFYTDMSGRSRRLHCSFFRSLPQCPQENVEVETLNRSQQTNPDPFLISSNYHISLPFGAMTYATETVLLNNRRIDQYSMYVFYFQIFFSELCSLWLELSQVTLLKKEHRIGLLLVTTSSHSPTGAEMRDGCEAQLYNFPGIECYLCLLAFPSLQWLYFSSNYWDPSDRP
jgi:hypothetical protein